MAQYQVKPPEQFSFKAEDWTKWIKRFERFRVASGLDVQADENQVNALIYCMGEEAEDILVSLHLSPEQASEYETVKQRFEAHFVARRNVIFERAKFNQRQQEVGESADSFITALHCLAEHCGYGPLHDEMVRDRLVVGLRDLRLSEQLQMDPELTLVKAVAKVKQSELIKKQQELLKTNFKAEVVNTQLDSVHSKPQGGVRVKQNKWQPNQTFKKTRPCSRCGDTKGHAFLQCPAREVICNNCKKKGHFARVCKSKKVHEVCVAAVSEDASSEEIAFLGTLSSDSADSPWMTELKIDNNSAVFKIDTGADVTAVPTHMYEKGQYSDLQNTKKVLMGPGRSQLKVKGKFTATLQRKDKHVMEDIYVVEGLNTPLLSRQAATALQLVARLDVTTLDSKETIKKEFPELFSGLGTMKGEYNIVLKPGAQPFSVSTPRRISLPLLPKVKEELNRMEQQGVISKVEQPTEWCAPMVVVPKRTSERVRICSDLTQLNKSVLRERHQLPSVENTLGQLSGAKVFSKLDANAGFWQIPLSKESSLLTTFITPFGRYCYNRLCFGLSSAPEHFQKRMQQILEGLEGVVCQMDDVLIWGSNQDEHDERLRRALDRLRNAGVTLNDKCEFSMSKIKFLGQVIEANGVSPDPEKVSAVRAMKEPSDISEVRRFLGMANHLGKFLPHLAEKTRPLRELLKKSNMWNWGQQQMLAFESIKQDLTTPPGLALYDPSADTLVSADSSSYGLGAVLLQKKGNADWKPVAYASRALTTTEQRYAQIEKEALATTWACERFAEFLIGKDFHIQTDHKPLVPLFGSRTLDELPPRIQRLRMRLMRFSFTISHVAGKEIATADVLSRAPVAHSGDHLHEEEIDLYADAVVASIPATEKRLKEIQMHQDKDEVLQQLKQFCISGWPNKFDIEKTFQPYLPFAGELTVQNGLLLLGCRLVIPKSLRLDILNKLHEGHLGITKCRERAKQSVWWPGLSKDLSKLVDNCDTCACERIQNKETMLASDLPSRPWCKVGADLFQLGKNQYLVLVDYFSRFFEIAKLSSTTSEAVIDHCKSIFARHGIPEIVRSDNGPQFASVAFQEFAQNWGFSHVTSSPHFPQSNGEVERAIRTIKSLLKKSSDPYLALMAYRASPLANGYSPTELLMGRKIRTTVPVIPSQLEPNRADLGKVRKTEKSYRLRQTQNYNRRHRAFDMPSLQPGDHVWVKDIRQRGTVVSTAGTPRSYIVETPGGSLRRNRYHLSETPVAPQLHVNVPSAENHLTETETTTERLPDSSQQSPQPEKRYPTRVRKPPGYLKDYVT
ncbi:uncharacterized protein K02A2.6-like [Fundulus heteroclitus]|uniref:uncharacterized protein K02A2.6-like n=1 Tax=Fundulus heteroclitus TaxID=8078 RepID=UPI00165B1E81|nr:uncharacterized protein K02A2.6-like [Fundulus heteroclitus]